MTGSGVPKGEDAASPKSGLNWNTPSYLIVVPDQAVVPIGSLHDPTMGRGSGSSAIQSVPTERSRTLTVAVEGNAVEISLTDVGGGNVSGDVSPV